MQQGLNWQRLDVDQLTQQCSASELILVVHTCLAQAEMTLNKCINKLLTHAWSDQCSLNAYETSSINTLQSLTMALQVCSLLQKTEDSSSSYIQNLTVSTAQKAWSVLVDSWLSPSEMCDEAFSLQSVPECDSSLLVLPTLLLVHESLYTTRQNTDRSPVHSASMFE